MNKTNSNKERQQSKLSVFFDDVFKVIGCFMMANLIIAAIILVLANSSDKGGSHNSHPRHHRHHRRH
jgi:hypothetical protein